MKRRWWLILATRFTALAVLPTASLIALQAWVGLPTPLAVILGYCVGTLAATLSIAWPFRWLK